MSQFEGFNKQYQKELQEQIDRLNDVLCTGNFETLEQYKLLAGKLSGIRMSLQRHRELLALMENDNDR